MMIVARAGSLVFGAAVLAVVGGLSSCAASAPPKPQMPSRPLDLHLPQEAPDEATMARLPVAWDNEALRAAFRLETGPLQAPDVANLEQLDGPLSTQFARSPFVVAEGSDDDRKLTTRLPSDPARPFMDVANKAFGAGQLDEALAGYRQVIERDPLFAKPYFYAAEIEMKRRDLEAATAWTDRGLRLSPRDAYGYSLRAEIRAVQGQDDPARAALAFALALDPFSPRGLKLLQQLGGARRPGIEPPVFIQLQAPPPPPPPSPDQKDQTPTAAPRPPGPTVLVARGGGHPAWQAYAVCRALLVYDRRIRSEFIQSPVQSQWPGTRSLEEETTCGYLATAAYRATAAGVTSDADLERWSRAYDANLLREAVIYETLACRRPEVLPLLDDEALRRMVEYVRLFVLPPPARGRDVRK
jgi:tetratricopeptide (TPR) repeat protein